MSKYAVIDLETTGFGKTDRIVEIGVVVVDPETGVVVDEFDTLLNPGRDIGATHVHGITATMVESAPTFEEIAGALSRVLGGNVLVAHNLPFDKRFLMQEFERAGIDVDPGLGVCTLKLSGEKLSVVCERHGIDIASHHRALADARATAQVLQHCDIEEESSPLIFRADVPVGVTRTLRRDSVGGQTLPITPSRFRVRYPTSDEMAMSYLNVLDAYLDDLELSQEEQAALAELAAVYELNDARQAELHEAYLASLIGAARRDGIVTASERELIGKVAAALGIGEEHVPPVDTPVIPSSINGARVCFTGQALYAGVQLDRDKLEAIAAENGLQAVSGVSKKNCDLVVAADPASTSGKAQKARQYGIPIISIEEFMVSVQTRAQE